MDVLVRILADPPWERPAMGDVEARVMAVVERPFLGPTRFRTAKPPSITSCVRETAGEPGTECVIGPAPPGFKCGTCRIRAETKGVLTCIFASRNPPRMRDYEFAAPTVIS